MCACPAPLLAVVNDPDALTLTELVPLTEPELDVLVVVSELITLL